eukprot:6199806-Pleurochrysis_carterae.AAC.1
MQRRGMAQHTAVEASASSALATTSPGTEMLLLRRNNASTMLCENNKLGLKCSTIIHLVPQGAKLVSLQLAHSVKINQMGRVICATQLFLYETQVSEPAALRPKYNISR